MPGPRIARPIDEMLVRLEQQLSMLESFSRAAFVESRVEFLPEVANKLRLLLVNSKSNKALLLQVAQELGIALEVTLDGPPGIVRPPGDPTPAAGETISLDRFFDLHAATIRTSAGLVSMTKRELIRAWCEQLGGAHEDWSVDEVLLEAVTFEAPILGFRPSVMELSNCVRTTLAQGRYLLQLAKRADNSGPTL